MFSAGRYPPAHDVCPMPSVATIEPMEAPTEKSLSVIRIMWEPSAFLPKKLQNEIAKHRPGFTISYEPDYRQQIADSWPQSIDDSVGMIGDGSRNMIFQK